MTRENTRNKLVIVFLVISLISLILVISPTRNYIEFYKTIQELHLSVVKIEYDIRQDTANISLIFVLVNPTGHTGLKLRSMSFGLSYEDQQHEVPLVGGVSWYEFVPIHPYSNMTFQYLLTLSANMTNTRSFIDYSQSSTRSIKWAISSDFYLITFVDGVHIPIRANYISHE